MAIPEGRGGEEALPKSMQESVGPPKGPGGVGGTPGGPGEIKMDWEGSPEYREKSGGSLGES